MTRKRSRLTRILAMITSLSILLATLSVMAFAEETAEELSPAASVSAPAAPQESVGESTAAAPVAAQASSGEVSADPVPAAAQASGVEGSADAAPAADSTYTFTYEGTNDMSGEGTLGNDTCQGFENWVAYVGDTHAKIFTLIDQATGNEIQVYCADVNTPACEGFNYERVNIEDADYYSVEEAEQIRAILTNGFWREETKEAAGSSEITSVAAPGQESSENQSLKALIERAAGSTDVDLSELTAEEALTATQWALWLNSNKHDHEMLERYYSKYIDTASVPDKDGTHLEYFLDENGQPMITNPVGAASRDRVFAVRDYLLGLEGIPAGSDKDSASTIFNDQNFVEVNTEKTEEAKKAAEAADTLVTELTEDGKVALQTGEVYLKAEDNADGTRDVYVVTKNADSTYTVEVFYNLKGSVNENDRLQLTVEMTDDSGKVVDVLSTDLNQSGSSETMRWSYDGESKLATLAVNMANTLYNFAMRLTGRQETDPGYYLYRSESIVESFEGEEFTCSSQSFVGWGSGETQVAASHTFTVDLRDFTDPVEPVKPADPAEPTEPETPDDPGTPEHPEHPQDTPSYQPKPILGVDFVGRGSPIVFLPQTGAVAFRSTAHIVLLGVSAAMACAAAALWFTLNRRKES